MPRINYKPSNWKSGETPRNVITLRDSLPFREYRSQITDISLRSIIYAPLLIFDRYSLPLSPPFPSVSKLTGYTKVELPKTRRRKGEGEGFRLSTRFKLGILAGRRFNFVRELKIRATNDLSYRSSNDLCLSFLRSSVLLLSMDKFVCLFILILSWKMKKRGERKRRTTQRSALQRKVF